MNQVVQTRELYLVILYYSQMTRIITPELAPNATSVYALGPRALVPSTRRNIVIGPGLGCLLKKNAYLIFLF